MVARTVAKCTADRCKVHRHGEIQEAFTVGPKDFLEYHKVPAGGHRKEFSKTLYYS